MSDDRTPSPQNEEPGLPNDDLEQEFYTALRAAGASAEDARSCIQAAVPAAAIPAALLR